MRFWERMALLVKADAHGVVDQLEERSLLLKQHLREAELELARKRARREAMEDEERRLAEEADRLEKGVEALDDDVSLALEAGNEELARFSVRRLIPLRRAAEAARTRGVALGAERARLTATLAGQERAFEELRARVRQRLAAEPRGAGARPGPTLGPVADEEVELELLRRRGADIGRSSVAGRDPGAKDAGVGPRVGEGA